MNTGLNTAVLSAQARAVRGTRLSCARAGLYGDRERMDMVLIEASAGSHISLQLTRNRFAAAPVRWCQRYLPQHHTGHNTYALINAGNANAGTGQRGFDDVARLHESLAGQVDCAPAQFLPFSTGVIGEYLPLEAMRAQIPELVRALSGEAGQWFKAAEAIMTTDTVAKLVSTELAVDGGAGEPVRISAIAKGSGMIHPDMATMLCFVACDASVAPDWFDRQLRLAVDSSFNSISVDGDTSTNDACLSILTGARSGALSDAGREALGRALASVLESLARQIVEDGEGARLRFTVQVQGAVSEHEARVTARTVATSPLVKTAVGARDPNWGRILAAVGRAPIASLDIDRVEISINGARIVSAGARDPHYHEALGAEAMSGDVISIVVDLKLGQATAHCHGCDLSAGYVRINSSYRS